MVAMGCIEDQSAQMHAHVNRDRLERSFVPYGCHSFQCSWRLCQLHDVHCKKEDLDGAMGHDSESKWHLNTVYVQLSITLQKSVNVLRWDLPGKESQTNNVCARLLHLQVVRLHREQDTKRSTIFWTYKVTSHGGHRRPTVHGM